MDKYYNLSLDLGTNSVGWAAVGQDFRVIKRGNQHLWGVVLFDEGHSAKDRRLARSARRRYERRRERIELLRELTAESVKAVDPQFFHRMDMSFLAGNRVDAKTGRNYRYNLFNGAYTDKQYYKEYPTIYHLRDALTRTTERKDIRLVYLAMHHIIKYRGNFLHEEESITVSGDGVIKLLRDAIELAIEADLTPEDYSFDGKDYYDKMKDKSKPRKDRQKDMVGVCGSATDFAKGMAKLLCGYLLTEKELRQMLKWEGEVEIKLQFGTDTAEEQLAACHTLFGDEIGNFLDALHVAYTEYCFVDILGEGNTSFSQAMMAKYEQHRKHLKLLKDLLRGNKVLYRQVFYSPRKNSTALDNYPSYVRTSTRRTRYSRKDSGKAGGCTREDFYKYVKSVLAQLPDSDAKAEVLRLIECETFMPRLNSTDNGVVPYQLGLNELKNILDNQAPYYPELAANRDKILSLLSFRRPYSVGTLKGGWIDQTIEERVYPWNFADKVNLDAANLNFIARMLSHDQFFPEEYVLPLQSITYQRYITLNGLNNLRYKGNPFPVEVKQDVFNHLIRGRADIKIKEILGYLNNHYRWSNDINDYKFTSPNANDALDFGMKTEYDLRTLFGSDYAEADVPLYDKVIECLTVFTDRDARKRVLNTLFQSRSYLRKYIDTLCKKKYAGWGKYSRHTLCEVTSAAMPPRCVLDLLYETPDNMQQIIHDERYGFVDLFQRNDEAAEALTYEALIEPLYADAAVKKAVWQAYKVVCEVVQIMGCEPQHIFVETTREDDVKGQKKSSRQKMLDLLYKNIQQQVAEYGWAAESYPSCKKELMTKEKEDGSQKYFDNEKVFLYFLQMGRCMYTGEPLSLDHLNDYEVDHIVPRSYITDNSLDNKALVLHSSNQRKRDQALSDAIIERMLGWWQFLQRKGFISQKKLDNLQRNHWDEQALSGFINRQLVETTQINKCFAEVIYRAFPAHRMQEQFVRNIRAGLSSNFRHMMTDEDSIRYGSFFKLRTLNDLHHAKDAYLAGVLGTFTTDLYPMWGQNECVRSAKQYMQEETEAARMIAQKNNYYGAILQLLRYGHYPYKPTNGDGEIIPEDVAFGNICRQMDHNDIAVVYIKEPWANSGFYNQTIMPAGKGSIPLRYVTDKDGNRVPLDTAIYGGYSNENCAYFVKVSRDKGKKSETTLVGIPVQAATAIKNGDTTLETYVRDNYSGGEVLGGIVYKYQLISLEGHLVYIVGEKEVQNARQLVTDVPYMACIAAIEHAMNLKKDKSRGQAVAEHWIENNAADVIERDAHGLVEQIVEKMRRYYPLYANIAARVKSFLETGFDGLSPIDKCQYIDNLLTVAKRGAGRVDMPKEWNGGSSWGRLTGKTIYPDKVKWLDQSVTGYYRTKK
ncbi:MAG: type II CRISPR RNA-guided endonuclease Cas9 [Clostridia bacterium]|nr:type II CRISPR RNA-guided endonuclease Cas9 [Clostridia bacterium]